MSLYYVQKLLYQLNRDAGVRKRFGADRASLLDEYELNAEERAALENGDVGLLYVMGVNGQLLMHYAASAARRLLSSCSLIPRIKQCPHEGGHCIRHESLLTQQKEV
jgi:hypothetical protein